MSIPLDRDRTEKEHQKGDFNWDRAVKAFARLRLETAYAVPTGESRRPNGFTEKLAAELNAFAQRHNRELP